MSKEIVLIRTKYQEDCILGHLLVFENARNGASSLIFECKTLELAYKDNVRSISSIPSGFYEIELEYSNRFDMELWELKGVPNRDEVKIHVANFYRQLNGCVAVGDMFVNLDNDKNLDLRNSRKTLNRFHEAMNGSTVSTIRIFGEN